MEQRPAQCWEQAIQLLQHVRAGPELFLPHARTGGVLTRPPRVSWAPAPLLAVPSAGTPGPGLYLEMYALWVVVKGCSRCCFRKTALARAFSVG